MDKVLSTLIQNPGWGFLAVVIVLIIINPSFLSEINKLIDRLSNRKEPSNKIENGKFTLFKLSRTLPETGIVYVAKIISTVCSALLIIGFVYLYWIIQTKPPEGGVSSALPLSFVIFVVLPVINIIDSYKPIRSSISLELDGNFEAVLRFCLKLLFDTKPTIIKFDMVTGQIDARLYGNQLTINIEKLGNSHNQLTLNSEGRLINALIYTIEFRRSINNLIHSLCYQKRIN